MTRSRILLASPVLLAGLVLAGCGGETGADGAGEPSSSPSETPSESPSESPGTPVPTGPNPPFSPTDYSYTLRISCYCPDAGAPIRVTVADGEVSDARWLRRSRDHAKDEAVTQEWQRLTIQDIIDAANDPEAADVKVEWPDGQDYPSEVSIDQDKQMVDEERYFTIKDVELAE